MLHSSEPNRDGFVSIWQVYKGLFLGEIGPFARRDRAAESLLFVHIQGEEGTSPVPVRGWGCTDNVAVTLGNKGTAMSSTAERPELLIS